MAYTTTAASTGNPLMGRIASLYANIVIRIKQRRAYRETYEGLSALNNRDLTDLGLTRSELHSVAKASARKSVAR